jgi:hypothetical protein
MQPSSARIIARPAKKGYRAQCARPFARRLLDQINARTNIEGLPIGIVITPGQVHDVTAFPALTQEIDATPNTTAKPFAATSSNAAARPSSRHGDAEHTARRRPTRGHRCET